MDACIAATFAACVAEPPLTGLYGGGFATVAGPDGLAESFDFFAASPHEAAHEHQASEKLDFWDLEVDFGSAKQVFHIGRGSVAVPLLARGLSELHALRGRSSKEVVVKGAKHLALEGGGGGTGPPPREKPPQNPPPPPPPPRGAGAPTTQPPVDNTPIIYF